MTICRLRADLILQARDNNSGNVAQKDGQLANLTAHCTSSFNPYVAMQLGGGVFYPPDALFILLLGNRFEL